MSIGPQYGAKGTCRSTLPAWEHGTAPCVAGLEGKRYA